MFLVLIVVLGFFLRVYKLSSLPLYGDELTIVYDAYSLLKTGKDQTGQSFPLTFKMGAGRPAGYVYGSIPFVAIFGPSIWGVRGLSVFSGIGIIILMYFLGKKLFDSKIGIIASFLTSVSMWDIYLSRGGFEAHFALFLSLLGIVLFLNKKYIPFAFSWGLAIFTYPTFKVTLPLLFLILIYFEGFGKVIKDKVFIVSVAILAIFAGISLSETFKGVSEDRFSKINLFSDVKVREQIVQKINEQRTLSDLPENLTVLIYNKPLNYSRRVFENYMQNISFDFLFLRGDRNPRHNPGEWGMLYLAQIPLLFVGFYNLYQKDKKKFLLLTKWVMIVPLAPMFLPETAHGLRLDLMLPALILVSAYALTKLNKKINYLIFLLFLVQFIYILVTIYFFAPNKFGTFWSKEAYETSLKVIAKKNNYDKIILSNNIDNIQYAYPVYAKIDPNLVISQYGKLPKEYGNVVITDNPENYEDNQNTLIIQK